MIGLDDHLEAQAGIETTYTQVCSPYGAPSVLCSLRTCSCSANLTRIPKGSAHWNADAKRWIIHQIASTIKYVNIEFDLGKSEANAQARGLPFSMVEEFDFSSAMFAEDIRKDYGEVRIQALGLLRDRVHVLVFTEVATGIRVISLRKANKREAKRYDDAQES